MWWLQLIAALPIAAMLIVFGKSAAFVSRRKLNHIMIPRTENIGITSVTARLRFAAQQRASACTVYRGLADDLCMEYMNIAGMQT